MAITSITYNNFDTFTMTILVFLALYICLHFSKSILFNSILGRGTKRVVGTLANYPINIESWYLWGGGLNNGILICVFLNFVRTEIWCFCHWHVF